MTVNVSWTDVLQLLTLLLSSGLLTFLIYNLRGAFNIPDSQVPEITHAVAIGGAILIAIVAALAKGQPLTAQLIVAAIFAGFGVANIAAGIHGNIKAKTNPKTTPGTAVVFPWSGPVPQYPRSPLTTSTEVPPPTVT